MPLIQKIPTSSGPSTGIVQLPSTARLIDPTLLSNQALTDLGFNPSNLPTPFLYPNGMAVSLINLSGAPTLVPTDQSSNVENFIGFLKGATDKDATNVPVLSIRGTEVSIFGESGMVFSSGDQIFLSSVVGRVTNTPDTTSNYTVTRVGFCFSNVSFILNTDATGKIL